MVDPKRERERGQALILALVVLLIASIAAALVGASIGIDQRAQIADLERAHSRQILDAALADALARRQTNPVFSGREEAFANGYFSSVIVPLSSTRFRVRVESSFRERHRAARCTVAVLPSGALRVLEWQPILGAAPAAAD